jgi:hypothetical protein
MKSSIGAFVAALVLAIGLASTSGFAVASSEASGQVGYDAQGNAGHIHTVVSGDTLWDISSAYLNTPWVWPSIWNENPAVANPHRIFPGDKIWISSNQMRRITDEEAAALLSGEPVVEEEVTEEVEVVEEEIPAAQGEIPEAVEEVDDSPFYIMPFRERDKRGVVDSEAFNDGSPIIVDSAKLRTLLGQGDEVYINLGEGEVAVGDRFNIVRAEGAIRDPETEKRLGYYVESLGWLEVIRVGPETATAKIKESRREIGRGDHLLPRVQDSPDIAVTMGAPGTSGQLAYVPDEREISGGFDVVFLNRGSSDGLEVGNLLEVVRYGGQRWGAAFDKKASIALPTEVVAHLVVLETKDDTSMAFVAHAADVVAVGDGFRTAERTLDF